MDTNVNNPSSDDTKLRIAPPVIPADAALLSPPNKRRLTRSPTPHTLAELSTLTPTDGGILSPVSSFSSSVKPYLSWTSSNSSATGAFSNSNLSHEQSNSSSSSRSSPTARMALFASLTRQTPEDAELARLTRANTKANGLIGRPPLQPTSPSFIPTSSPPRSTMILPSFLARTIPSTPLYMTDNKPSSGSASPVPSAEFPQASPLLSAPEDDSYRKKRRMDGGNQDTILQPRAVLAQREHEDSLNHTIETSIPVSPSTTPPLSLPPSISQHTDRFKSPSSVKFAKTVRFDETKNSFFGYERGSMIALSSLGDDSMDRDHLFDFEEENNHGDSLSASSTRIWSSRSVSGIFSRPNQSDVEASTPNQLQSLSFDPYADKTVESASQQEQRRGLSTSLQASASSGRQLWSPPGVRRSLSDVSTAKRSSSLISTASASSPTTASEVTGHRKMPLLKRQSSMSLISSVNSDDPSIFSEEFMQDLAIPPHREPSDECKDQELATVNVTSNTRHEDGDVVMREDPALGPLFLSQAAGLDRATSLLRSEVEGERRTLNGPIRNRNTAGRFFSPYRRPTASMTDPARPRSSSSGMTSFAPPKLVRSASFSIERQKAPVPVLRREASTTAFMDTLT